jgi:ABC-2 type transport system permease protein
MLGHTLAYMIIAVVQVVLVLAASYLIGYRPSTGIPGIAFTFVITLAFSLVSVGFGLIAATVSKTAETSTGVSFAFIMPQLFLGTFMPLGGGIEVFAQFMPSKHLTDAITTLFLRGAPITATVIWAELALVSVVGILLIAVGVLLFERYGSR